MTKDLSSIAAHAQSALSLATQTKISNTPPHSIQL